VKRRYLLLLKKGVQRVRDRSFQVQGTYTPPQILLQFVYDSGQACSYIATLKTGVTMVGTQTCGTNNPTPVNYSR
jgi:hypothetical protein